MKIRILSDLHTEFSDFEIPWLNGDAETVLVLAGDIGLVHKANLNNEFILLLVRAEAQFRKTIIILGNHEHYGGSFVRTYSILKEAIEAAGLKNVILLEKETHVVDDVAFIGATLWTDCDKHSPHANYLFGGMSDSKVVRTGPNASLPYERKFSATDTWVDHGKAKKYIFKEAVAQKAAGNKVVLVVHHGVTGQSIAPQYAGSPMNMFFASEMTNSILDAKPDLIIHGHTHTCLSYTVGTTPVVANPRGYVVNGREPENPEFNPTLTVEL